VIHRLLDRLAERYGEREHKIEAMRAREEYFERAGKVFDDDAELFEGRMASFLEWYLIERRGPDGAPPPVIRALAGDAPSFDFGREERRALSHVAASHRSLFELYGAAEHLLDIEDVIGGGRFAVIERRKIFGFSPGDLFEARLVWDAESDAVIFGRTFLFHPPDAREEVLGVVDRAVERGAARDEILFGLSRNYIRWHRFGHVGAAKIYRGGDSST
jgi:hypothetical protein